MILVHPASANDADAILGADPELVFLFFSVQSFEKLQNSSKIVTRYLRDLEREEDSVVRTDLCYLLCCPFRDL